MKTHIHQKKNAISEIILTQLSSDSKYRFALRARRAYPLPNYVVCTRLANFPLILQLFLTRICRLYYACTHSTGQCGFVAKMNFFFTMTVQCKPFSFYGQIRQNLEIAMSYSLVEEKFNSFVFSTLNSLLQKISEVTMWDRRGQA